jgi:hypothetical protein
VSDLDRYIEIRPQDFVLLLIARLQRDIELAQINPANWWFIIQDLDLALTAQLVAFLSGTAQIGALTNEHQIVMLAYLNDRSEAKQGPKDKRGNPIVEKLAPFKELLTRATDPNCQLSYVSETRLILSDAEKKDMLKIHSFRNDLAHVKPRSWYVEIAGLPRMATVCVKAIAHLFSNCSQRVHLTELEITQTEASLKLILGCLFSMQIKPD